jgi:hypothetical protein
LDDVTQVVKWYFAGNTDGEVRTGDTTFNMAAEGTGCIESASRAAGDRGLISRLALSGR